MFGHGPATGLTTRQADAAPSAINPIGKAQHMVVIVETEGLICANLPGCKHGKSEVFA